MAYNGRRIHFGNESVEEKIRKYTQPHPVVTSHLHNNLQNFVFRNTFAQAQNTFNRPMSPYLFAERSPFPSPQPLLGRNYPLHPTNMAKSLPVFSRNNQSKNTVPRFSSNNTASTFKNNSTSPMKNNMNSNRKRSHASSTITSEEDEAHGKRKKPLSGIEDQNKRDYSQLTKEMETYLKNHSQSKELLEKKLKLRAAILCVIRRQFPGVSLHLVGSSCNGFAADTSDADFCIMIAHERKVDQTHEARYYLKAIEKLIRPLGSLKGMQFIRAKVPILKFKDVISGCDCDININNATGIRNTHLLRTYSKVDDRVRPVVMAIKKWAKSRKINDASQGTLSSYSLVLMIIHYLQCGCDPPVLPSLQQKYPNYFKGDSNVDDLPMFEPADMIPHNSSNNDQSVGELLEGFFKYFAETFLWDMKVMSVRLGYTLAKKGRFEFKDKYISIEEPFELTNTARAVHEMSKYILIKREFQRANNCLKANLSMNSIT